MRKRNFLKAVCLFTCLSILMLSVPGAIASERTDKKFYKNLYMRTLAILSSFLPFLNLNIEDDTSSDTVSNDGSGQKIKVTGTLSLIKGPRSSNR